MKDDEGQKKRCDLVLYQKKNRSKHSGRSLGYNPFIVHPTPCIEFKLCPLAFEDQCPECEFPISLREAYNPRYWPAFGRDADNSSSSYADPLPNSIIDLNATNAGTLALDYSTTLTNGAGEVFANPTSDGTDIFLGAGEWLYSINRSTGAVNWSTQISSYTNITGDQTRSAPTVWQDFLFVATAPLIPQSMDLLEGDNFFNTLYGPVVSREQLNPLEPRAQLLKINKADGTLVWSKPIGQRANTMLDPDNWLIVTASPVVTNVIIDGACRPVVIVGTDTAQNTVPWTIPSIQLPPTARDYWLGDSQFFQFTDVGKIIVFDAIEPAPPLPASPSISETLLTVGKPAGGTVISGNPDFFAPGQEILVTPIYVSSDPRMNTRAELSPSIWQNYQLTPDELSRWPGYFQRIVFFIGLTTIVPNTLNGYQVRDPVSLALVPLVGGAVNPTNSQLTISVRVEMMPGTNMFTIHDVDDGGAQWTSPLTPYSTTLVTDLPDGSTVLKYWRFDVNADPFPMSGATIQTALPVITYDPVLGPYVADYDAYAFSYFGATMWGNTFSVKLDPCCKTATQVFFGTGNNHHVPLSEQFWLYRQLYFGVPDFPQVYSADTIERLVALQCAGGCCDTAAPLTLPYFYREDLMAQAYASGAGNQPALIDTMYRTKKQYVLNELSIPLSVRGGRNYHASLVSLNLSDGPRFGMINWAQRMTAYDQYHDGFALNALSLSNPNGWSSIQNFYSAYRGADDQFGAGPVYLHNVTLPDYAPVPAWTCCVHASCHKAGKNRCLFLDPCGKDEKCKKKCELRLQKHRVNPELDRADLLVGASTGGDLIALRLDPDHQSPDFEAPKVRYWTYVGNPGPFGGAIYGIATDGQKIYTLQTNVGPAYQNAWPIGTYPQNFAPPYAWLTRPVGEDVTVKLPGQSYVSAADGITGTIEWEHLIVSGLTAPAPTVGALGVTSLPVRRQVKSSSNACKPCHKDSIPCCKPPVTPLSDNLVYYGTSGGNIELLNARDGALVQTLASVNNTAGIAKPIVIEGQLYASLGYTLPAIVNTGSTYGPTDLFSAYTI